MDCKLIDCEAEATGRVITPYGTVNLCGAHCVYLDAELADRHEGVTRPTLAALAEVMRYGPAEDPPIEDEGRDPGLFPKFQRRGPVTDVLWPGPAWVCEVTYCAHGKNWPEGGHGCLVCLEQMREERRA
jgi:hypothetical protein